MTTQATSDHIAQAVEAFALKNDAEIDWGREDGYTWVEIAGEGVTPDRYKELSQGIADAAGVDFFFKSISVGSMEGPLDWDMNSHERYTDQPDTDISDYGTKFSAVPRKTAQPKS